jgi:hypothetical protein
MLTPATIVDRLCESLFEDFLQSDKGMKGMEKGLLLLLSSDRLYQMLLFM